MSACGPIPKPFLEKPVAKVSNPLLTRGDSAGLVVAPIEGAPSELAGPLAEAMADSLRRHDVPATTTPSLARGHLLEGEAVWNDGVLVLVWHVTDLGGETLGQASDVLPVPRDAFQDGAPALIESVVARGTPSVVDILTRRNIDATVTVSDPAPEPPPDVPRIAVLGVTGAPGDGDRTLPSALGHVIRQSGLPFTTDPSEAALQLTGIVEAEEGEAVTIVWWMLDHEGVAIGSLDQPVPVPPAEIADRWGANAYEAALALLQPLASTLDMLVARQQPIKAPPEEDYGAAPARKKLVLPF